MYLAVGLCPASSVFYTCSYFRSFRAFPLLMRGKQYKIWRPTQKRKTSLHNASDLKQRTSLKHGNISQTIIDKPVWWRK